MAIAEKLKNSLAADNYTRQKVTGIQDQEQPTLHRRSNRGKPGA
jgi:hypothetical protein